jgi:seryl-tRNA synthetase
MIDIKQIRENPQKFKAACEAKKFNVNIDRLLEADSELRAVKQQLQDISTDKNRIGKSIPKLSADKKQSALTQLSELKEREAKYDDDVLARTIRKMLKSEKRARYANSILSLKTMSSWAWRWILLI